MNPQGTLVMHSTAGVAFMGTPYIKGIARNVSRRFHDQTQLIRQWWRPQNQVVMGVCSYRQAEVDICCRRVEQSVQQVQYEEKSPTDCQRVGISYLCGQLCHS